MGVRATDYVSVFPAGGTIAASWDRGEWYLRGYQLGQENRAKGVDVHLGPVVGPLGRNPKAGVSSRTGSCGHSYLFSTTLFSRKLQHEVISGPKSLHSLGSIYVLL